MLQLPLVFLFSLFISFAISIPMLTFFKDKEQQQQQQQQQGLAMVEEWDEPIALGIEEPHNLKSIKRNCKQGSFGWQNLEAKDSQLSVHYPNGSWSKQATEAAGKRIGGAQFYFPFDSPSDSAHLSYEILVPETFDFVKGGKLPGLFGGSSETCKGGKESDGINGFSSRLMWRPRGVLEAYLYIPTDCQTNGFCSRKDVVINRLYGHSLGRHSNIALVKGQASLIEQIVKLNTPGHPNGHLLVKLNGKVVVDEKSLVFRCSNTLQINGLFFSTFFGGNSIDYATTKDEILGFRNFTVRFPKSV